MKPALAGRRRGPWVALVGMVAGIAVITAGVGILTSRLSADAWTVVEDSAGAGLSTVTCANSSDC